MQRGSLALRILLVAMLLSFSSSFAFSQRMNPARTEDANQDTDRAAERLMWFMEGRLTPDGKAPAEKAQKAHQRRMEMRAEREKQLRLNSASPNATVPVGGAASNWTPVGPAPILNDGSWGTVTGRIAAVAVDQSDTTGNTVIVGGAFGGVWRSINAAASDPTQVTWTPLIDAQATLAVGAIALKPDNHNVILVGTGEAKSAIDSYYGRGILRSVDGGTNWTQITQAATGQVFLGLGFGRFAWSTTNTNLVIAATTTTAVGNRTGSTALTNAGQSGLYYSTDAGATWNKATMQDGVGQPVSAAVHSVTFNAAAGKFFAAVRFHGIYESADGQTFTRSAVQPDAANVSLTNCPTSVSTACPFYRGELAVVPGRNEMYVWYTQANGDPVTSNRGAFYTRDGGATWRTLDVTGMNACGDSDGCGASQGYFYNMAIAAVPAGTQTDLYLGAVNLFKCRIDPANATSLCNGAEPNKFMNVTHVYGPYDPANLATSCGWGLKATFHPDNHSYDFSQAHPEIVYFGNDGGIYRTLTSQSILNGTCNNVKQPFQDLNNASLSLTQFVWGSAHPTDTSQFMGGAQDNGTSLTYSAIKGANGQIWKPILSGDGGYNAFLPTDGNTVIASYVNANVYICAGLGINCDLSDWGGANQLILPSNLKANGTTTQDASPFYTVWELDKRDSSKLVIGSCRVWRGSSTTNWTTAPPTQISGKLNNTSGQTYCASNDSQIYALATGGPAGTGGVAKVIYAGLSNGSIFRTSNADAASPTWSNVTPPTTLNPGPSWTSGSSAFRISNIAIDPGDATGMTAYATIQGFMVPHVIKTVDGGANWTNFTGNLPDAPANNVVVDPDDSTVVYVGTDLGVFSTQNAGATWVEVGSAATNYLPNVVVTRVLISKIGSVKTLYAVTYGRGVWKTDISASTGTPNAALAPTSLDWSKVNVNSTPANKTFTITNTGTQSLTIASIANFGYTTEYNVTHNCGAMPATLAANAACTVTVAFHPTATGAHNASVVVTSDSGGTVGNQKTVSLAGTAEDFGTPTVANTTVAVTKGGSANFGNVMIPAVGGYSSAITMSCSGLPSGAQCNFSSNPIPAPGNAAATTALTISTAAASMTTPIASNGGNSRPLFAFWSVMPGMALLLPAVTDKKRKWMTRLGLMVCCLLMLLSLAACGSGNSSSSSPQNPGTPAGTYTVTVTATSGTLAHSSNVTLTVQ